MSEIVKKPDPKDLFKQVAMDIGKEVVHHIETMYPAAIEAVPSTFKLSVRNNEKGKPLQVDGWHFWKFNKDGERTPLSELRDEKDIRRRPDLQKSAAA